MIAASRGQVGVVQELIKYGADINTKNNEGKISHYFMPSKCFFL